LLNAFVIKAVDKIGNENVVELHIVYPDKKIVILRIGNNQAEVNGQIVQSGRSSAAYLDTICQAFTDESVPELCGGTLDDTNPAPGFGWDGGSSGGTTAQC